MAEINAGGQGRQRSNKCAQRSKKLSTKVDLTPMVDLGFLLITFFLFTTTLAKPRLMNMTMPYQPKDRTVETAWKNGQTITLLLSKNHRIFYYTGIGDLPANPPTVRVTSFQNNEIRGVVQGHLKQVKALINRGVLESGNEAAFLIKPDTSSTYSDFVNLLDELAIDGVNMKAVVDITPADQQLIANHAK